MADFNLRRLERAAHSGNNPEIWASYINAAVRAGEFDPLEWDQAVSYLAKIPRPVRPNYQTLIEEGYGENYQEQTEQYLEQQDVWYQHEQKIIDILHQIRLTNGHWGSQQIAQHINRVFPHLFKENYHATVETAELRRQQEADAIIHEDGSVLATDLEGPEEIDTDIVTIAAMDTYVSFDEKTLVPSRQAHGKSESAIPRPVNDFTTQVYVVSRWSFWSEAHGEEMSEVIEVARYMNPHQLIFGLMEMILGETSDALADIYHERQVAEDEQYWELGDF